MLDPEGEKSWRFQSRNSVKPEMLYSSFSSIKMKICKQRRALLEHYSYSTGESFSQIDCESTHMHAI